MNETTNTNAVAAPPIETWAIVELLGHVRIAGRLTEETHFGVALGRLDIPTADGGFTTQFFGGSSVYRITPATEEIARHVAVSNQPEPVHRWELPKPKDDADDTSAYHLDDSDEDGDFVTNDPDF